MIIGKLNFINCVVILRGLVVSCVVGWLFFVIKMVVVLCRYVCLVKILFMGKIGYLGNVVCLKKGRRLWKK